MEQNGLTYHRRLNKKARRKRYVACDELALRYKKDTGR